MHLSNINNIRIKRYSKGFIVQIQKKTWYGKKYWIHLISVAGIESMPWYFKTYESALDEAVRYFKWDLMEGTQMLS